MTPSRNQNELIKRKADRTGDSAFIAEPYVVIRLRCGSLDIRLGMQKRPDFALKSVKSPWVRTER